MTENTGRETCYSVFLIPYSSFRIPHSVFISYYEFLGVPNKNSVGAVWESVNDRNLGEISAWCNLNCELRH